MGTYVRQFEKSACALCGSSSSPLSREHKIKASVLRAQFGSDGLLVGSRNEGPTTLRMAQSSKSDHLKFKSGRICQPCNNVRTQPADIEFDRFIRFLQKGGGNPSRVFAMDRYQRDTSEYLNVFRYFAKLICCQMAEVGAPTLLRLARFAIGEADDNCVWLRVDEDAEAASFRERGLKSYAAHGGLVTFIDKKTGMPTRFVSSLTVGPLFLGFHFNATRGEQRELAAEHPQFVASCNDAVDLLAVGQS